VVTEGTVTRSRLPVSSVQDESSKCCSIGYLFPTRLARPPIEKRAQLCASARIAFNCGEIRFSRLAPISFRHLSTRDMGGPPYIPHLSSFSPPSLCPPYRHDIHSSHSRSHPCIPCWPIITTSTCSFSRPTPSHRTLLRWPEWVQVTRGHDTKLHPHHFPVHMCLCTQTSQVLTRGGQGSHGDVWGSCSLPYLCQKPSLHGR